MQRTENTKMAKNNQNILSMLTLFLIGQLILLTICVQAIEPDYTKLEKQLFYLRNFNTSSIIDKILFHNWTENHECLTELNAIRKGLQNHEEWAIRGKLYFSYYIVSKISRLSVKCNNSMCTLSICV